MARKTKTLSTTCRVCLRFGKKVLKNCKSLFETHNNTSIWATIVSIADIKIEERDGLPSIICAGCLEELDTAINFKLKCERSNKLLRSEKVKVNIKILPIAELPCSMGSVKTEDAPKNDLANEKKIYITDSEEYKQDSPHIEKPCSEDLVKKEDDSGEDLQHDEIKYCDDVTERNYFKLETDQTETEETLEIKPMLENDAAKDTAACDSSQIPYRPSRAIDLKLECHDCGGIFKSKCKLKVHWKKVHLHEKLTCDSCKRSFKSFPAFNKHKKIKPKSCTLACHAKIEVIGKTRIYHCKHCEYTAKKFNNFRAHLVIHTGERQYVCDLCSRAFTQIGALSRHREEVHKIILKNRKETTCQYCGLLVQGCDKIRRHMRRHEWTPVQCDICKKMFKTKYNLRIHMNIHFGNKSFVCDECGKACSSYSILWNHKKTKHNEKSYFTCDICGFKLLKKRSMIIHKSKHTNANVGCNVCGRFYPNAEELAIHNMIHSKEPSVCLQCNKVLSSQRALQRHKLGTHKHKKKSMSERIKVDVNDSNSSYEKVEVEIIPNWATP